MRRYSEREDEIIRAYYPTHGITWDGWAVYLPGRTPDGIGARARHLGIYCDKKSTWAPEEIEALRANYGIHQKSWSGWRRILPNRTWSGICNMAGKLGLPAACRWSDEDRKTLMRHLISAARETGHTPHGCMKELSNLARYMRGGRMPVIAGGEVRYARDTEPAKAS